MYIVFAQVIGTIAALFYLRAGVYLICPRDDISGAYHSVETVQSCDIPISTAVEKQTLFWKRTVQEISYQSVPSFKGYPPARQVLCRGSLLLLERVNEWFPTIVSDSGWVEPKSVIINPCEDLEAIASREGLVVVSQQLPNGKAMVLAKPEAAKSVQLPSVDGGALLELPMIGQTRDKKESRDKRKKKKDSNSPKQTLELSPPTSSSSKREGEVDVHLRKKNPIEIIVSGLVNGLKHLIRFLIPIPKKVKVAEDKEGTFKRKPETAKAPLDWSEDVSSPLSLSLTPSQTSLISTLNQKFKARVMEDGNSQTFEKRMEGVRWGGPATSTKSASFSWYFPTESSKSWGVDKEEDGTRLLAALLKIVKWPSNLISNFPFNLCGAQSCPLDVSLKHTLEFREKFQPWKMTDAAYRENELGWMYVRGHSPTRYHEDASKGGYSLLWYRPGKKKIEAYEPYIRVVINSLDRCVADSLNRSGGHIGKCNIVLDCDGFGMRMIPPMKFVKTILPMMQDHFPDRMGVLVLVNLAGAAQIFMGIVTPFLPDAVKKKIHVLPNDEPARTEMLKELMVDQFVPTWLGGKDGYSFNSAEYYKKGEFESEFFSNEEGIEYVETMPYHA